MILSVVDLTKFEQQQPRLVIEKTYVAKSANPLVAPFYLNRLA